MLCVRMIQISKPCVSKMNVLVESKTHYIFFSFVLDNCQITNHDSDVNVPLPSLGSVYGTCPSSLEVGKVETGCPVLVLLHVVPRTGGCHRRLVTGTVAVHM